MGSYDSPHFCKVLTPSVKEVTQMIQEINRGTEFLTYAQVKKDESECKIQDQNDSLKKNFIGLAYKEFCTLSNQIFNAIGKILDLF